jgi:toxin ParE1/3/4
MAMRRLKVTYRPEAINDLGEIYRYVLLRSQNRLIAQEFVRRIKKRCSKIGLVPNGGAPRHDLGTALRMVPFEHSAVIIYEIEANCVRIANVFYGGRDYEAFYLGVLPDDADHENEL